MSVLPELFQDGTLDYFRNVVSGEEIEEFVHPMIVSPRKWNLRRIMRIVFNVSRIPNPMIKQYIKLYDYFDPSYDEIYSVIQKELGWVSPKDKIEHMDCKIHDIAHYIHTSPIFAELFNIRYSLAFHGTDYK